MIFVTKEEFEKLKEANVGVCLTDSFGTEQIIYEDTIIKIYNPPS